MYTDLADSGGCPSDEYDLSTNVFFEHGSEDTRDEASEGEEGPEYEEECGEAEERNNQVQEHLEEVHGYKTS